MSYTPFKMAPKGPIMKQMHSAKKGKSPYEYEADGADLAARKNKEAINKVKSKSSAHGQGNDAEEEAKNDIALANENKKRNSNTPKRRSYKSKDKSNQYAYEESTTNADGDDGTDK